MKRIYRYLAIYKKSTSAGRIVLEITCWEHQYFIYWYNLYLQNYELSKIKEYMQLFCYIYKVWIHFMKLYCCGNHFIYFSLLHIYLILIISMLNVLFIISQFLGDSQKGIFQRHIQRSRSTQSKSNSAF